MKVQGGEERVRVAGILPATWNSSPNGHVLFCRIIYRGTLSCQPTRVELNQLKIHTAWCCAWHPSSAAPGLWPHVGDLLWMTAFPLASETGNGRANGAFHPGLPHNYHLWRVCLLSKIVTETAVNVTEIKQSTSSVQRSRTGRADIDVTWQETVRLSQDGAITRIMVQKSNTIEWKHSQSYCVNI